jgi:transaldolase
MGKNLLEQLRDVTIVVADTGDIQAIETFKPHDATTNPSLITAAAQMPQYQGIVDDTLKGARETLGADASAAKVVSLAFERLAVSFGCKILEVIPGRVSTEVDARLSYDTVASIAMGRELIKMYEAQGV